MAAARARGGHAVASEAAAREGEARLLADAARRLATLVVLVRREALDSLGGQLEQVVAAVVVGEELDSMVAATVLTAVNSRLARLRANAMPPAGAAAKALKDGEAAPKGLKK